MTMATDYASTLPALCDQLEAFCAEHLLPALSADELLCELYGQEPRRDDLCRWLRGFIDAWDEACEIERRANSRQEAQS